MHRSNADFEVDIVRPEALSAADVAAWDALRAQDPVFLNPLLGHGFALAVAQAREDVAVAVYRKAGQPVGFLAHHRRPGGLGRPVGAPFSDYHGLVAAPDAGLDGRQALELAGLKTFRHIGLVDPNHAFEGLHEGSNGFAIVLDGSGAAYLETLRPASPKRFKNWRRLRHRLEEIGELRLRACTGQDNFDLLLKWKREQFLRTGAQDVLHPDWVQRLMQGMFGQREGPVQGLMLTLHAGDRLVAGHFGVREGEVYHPWIASADPDLSHASPGQAYLWHAILAMPDLGLTTYDLGTGHDHYKRPFANVMRATLMGQSAANGTPDAKQGPMPIEKIRRRLDHIATTELTLAGRAQGLMQAALALRHRSLLRENVSAD